jgi:hypothetical protein
MGPQPAYLTDLAGDQVQGVNPAFEFPTATQARVYSTRRY